MTDEQREKPQLTPHLVAFIDVMGSKDFSKKEKHKQKLFEFLVSIHLQDDGIFQAENQGHVIFQEYKPQITSFSDCIILSLKIDKDPFKGVSWDAAISVFRRLIAELFFKAIKSGFLLRGAIDIGELYHNKNLIFGEALVDAFLAESNQANFPRVILTDKCIASFPDFARITPVEESIENLCINSDKENFESHVQKHRWSSLYRDDFDGRLCVRLINDSLPINKISGDVEIETFKSGYDKFYNQLIDGKNNCNGISHHEGKWIYLMSYYKNEFDIGVRSLENTQKLINETKAKQANS